MRRVHHLKTWPAPFQAAWDEQKLHEVRIDDRGFAVGDGLVLEEYDPKPTGFSSGRYTDRAICALVTFKSEGGTWGLPAHLCVMSVRQLNRTTKYTVGCFDTDIRETP